MTSPPAAPNERLDAPTTKRKKEPSQVNIDNGNILPWAALSPEEKESGRWVKLSDDEHAMAQRVEEKERALKLNDLFQLKEAQRDYESRLARFLRNGEIT